MNVSTKANFSFLSVFSGFAELRFSAEAVLFRNPVLQRTPVPRKIRRRTTLLFWEHYPEKIDKKEKRK
jgi:hypothetical protein